MQVSLSLSHRNTKRFNQFKNHYERFVDKSADPTISVLDVGLSYGVNSFKYYTAGINVGDKVYFFPYNTTQILVIDSTDDSYYYVGNFAGSGKFRLASLSPNGFIYAYGGYGSILKFNPKDDTFSTFGTTSTNYLGGCILVGSKIYGTPNVIGVDTIQIIDTETDTVSYETISGWNTSHGAIDSVALSIDNKFIYGIKNRIDGTDNIFKIEVETLTATHLTIAMSPGVTNVPWSSVCLHPNGKMYFCPSYEIRWLIIDTLNGDSISYSNNIVGTSVSNVSFQQSLFLGINGNFYTTAFNNDSFRQPLELDTVTDQSVIFFNYSTIGSPAGRLWYNSVSCPNGVVYSAPFDAKDVLKHTFNNTTNFNKEFTQSPWFNKNR